MKVLLSFSALLLATTACTTAAPPPPSAQAPVAAAPAPAPVVDPAAEDQRLMAFLDSAFEEQAARSPQYLTALGRKDRYDRLDIYTDEYRQQGIELVQRQLAQMRAQFDPAALSPSGRLSYRLFEEEVEQDVANFRWRRHGFPASTNGSPMGSIPAFLINQHRIDSVADAEAYVSRLRDVERVLSEIRPTCVRRRRWESSRRGSILRRCGRTPAGCSRALPSPTARTRRCSPTSRQR